MELSRERSIHMLFQKRVGMILVAILCVFIYSMTAEKTLWAQEQGPINPGATVDVQIKNKFKQGFLSDQGRFIVTSETTVFMENGREISYDLLPVPCEAKITFYPAVNSDQTALKIVITDVSPGAVRYFQAPAPE
ncbi:MAG: hypothetical protein EHM45_20495 [Desulfobacteraceae bacterium]|nr:MAG: hypothetical protein EHM45_20495 [Desulfobacteraceae bacterium]